MTVIVKIHCMFFKFRVVYRTRELWILDVYEKVSIVTKDRVGMNRLCNINNNINANNQKCSTAQDEKHFLASDWLLRPLRDGCIGTLHAHFRYIY